MRRTITILASAMVAVALGGGLQACAGPEPAPTSSSVVERGDTQSTQQDKKTDVALSEDSILLLGTNEASKKLVEDMAAGNLPTKCTVLYDQMGSLPSVDVKEAAQIQEVYERLARMRVVGESNMSMTDCYHFVSFELQDGTTVSYHFEGEGLYVSGKTNYAVLDSGNLWSYVRQLQGVETQARAYRIELDDEDHLVESCPTEAVAGEIVHMQLFFVTDAVLKVEVNGQEGLGAFVPMGAYEFVMPESDAVVHVWADTSIIAGA